MQGVGKSTETNFLVYHVFGTKVSMVCTTTDPLLTSYNKILLGKVYVVFEELPAFSQAQWMAIGGKIKTMATEKNLQYSDKYEKSITAPNNINLAINTNVPALKDIEGRRIYLVMFNTSRKSDYVYFEDIHDCMKNDVGEAFYSYLMVKVTDDMVNNFKAERDLPQNRAKLNGIANSLPSAYKFIKEKYVLKRQKITKIKRSELYKLYICYTTDNTIKHVSGRNDFYDKLKEIGIVSRTSTGNEYFDVSIEQLEDIATKFQWVCEYDEYEKPEDKKDDVIDYKYRYEEAGRTILKLKNKIQALEEKLNSKNTIENIVEDEKTITEDEHTIVEEAEEEKYMFDKKPNNYKEVKVVEVKKEKKNIIKAKKDIECESLFDTILSSVPDQRNVEAEKIRDEFHERLQKYEDEEKKKPIIIDDVVEPVIKQKRAKKITIKAQRVETTEDEEREDMDILSKDINDLFNKKSKSK